MSNLMNSALYELFYSPDDLVVETTGRTICIKIKVGTNGAYNVLFNQEYLEKVDIQERVSIIEEILRDALNFGMNFDNNGNSEISTSVNNAVLSEDRIQKIIDEIKKSGKTGKNGGVK